MNKQTIMNSFEKRTQDMFVFILDTCTHLFLKFDIFNTIDSMVYYLEPSIQKKESIELSTI